MTGALKRSRIYSRSRLNVASETSRIERKSSRLTTLDLEGVDRFYRNVLGGSYCHKQKRNPVNPEPFFTTIPLEVLVASASIAILTIIFGFRWNPSITETTRDLTTLRKYFHQAEPSGKFAIKEANRKTSKQNIKAILAEVESGLFELPGDLGSKTYSLHFYQEIRTPRALLARKVKLVLYDAAPNILIGIGLLFTFSFLAL